MTFAAFYRDVYLERHAAPVCRLFHLLGLLASACWLGLVVWLRIWWLLVFLALPTYLVAWLGHVLANNQPTFFAHPFWSFFAFWKMIASILVGRIGWQEIHPGRKP
jgi:hypothetical protein